MDFKWILVTVYVLVIVWVLDLKKVLLSFLQNPKPKTTPELSDVPLSGAWVMPDYAPEPTTDASQSPPNTGTKLVRYLQLKGQDGIANQNVAAYNGTHACKHFICKCVHAINVMRLWIRSTLSSLHWLNCQ